MIQITALGEGERDDSPPVDIGSSVVVVLPVDAEPTDEDEEDFRTVP